MTIRSKFRLSEIHHLGNGGRRYVFTTEYDSTIPEDQRFFKASPSGRLEIVVDNPHVYEHWLLGHSYYFDATHVPIPAG